MNIKQPAVYIIANQKNGTLYTGVTSNLIKRITEHKEAIIDGFSKRYNCKLLVFYEMHDTIELAIFREKQIKNVSRREKIELINSMNEEWRDLYSDII
jgi:putative endonuclease